MVQINTAWDVYFRQFLCIYHSVEIGVTRIAFFSLFLVMTQCPRSPILYCGTSILDWVHPSCLGPFTWVDSGDTGSQAFQSFTEKPFGFVSLHSWGFPTLGAADLRYRTSPTWVSRNHPPHTHIQDKTPFLRYWSRGPNHNGILTAACDF